MQIPYTILQPDNDDELRVIGLKMHCPTGSKYDASLQRCCTQCVIGEGACGLYVCILMLCAQVLHCHATIETILCAKRVVLVSSTQQYYRIRIRVSTASNVHPMRDRRISAT